MYSGASNFVEGVDKAFMLIMGISIFFLIGITTVMIIFLFKYSRKKNKKPSTNDGSVKLEIIWTAIPLVLVMLMFYYGWVGYAPMRKVPDDAMLVKVTGKMWQWIFEYENGKTSLDLVIPINKPVRLDLYSPDVNHSLFIPAFRVKEDVVPGYDNYLWFTPYYIGDYEILCAEYCGLMHSYMTAKAKVVSQEEFDTWIADFNPEEKQADHPGLLVINANACTACHSLDGTRLVGSSFKDLWGAKKTILVGGKEKEITVDADYIRKSIYNPDEEIVQGFSKGLMRSYTGVISNDDMDKIIEYLKTIKQ
jgi:cytochrome c oxidase subunit II